jgi:CheY-like chemotaxis protein
MGEKRLNVLVVDDEHLVRWSVCRYLEAEGFGTHEAECGNSAMEVLRQQAIDILITDIMMPFMDGIELMQQARELVPELKMLAITANDTPENLRSAQEAGAIETITKPIPFNKLMGTLQKVV